MAGFNQVNPRIPRYARSADAGRVSYAWKMPGGIYQHVLVDCDEPDVFLVLVLDLPASSVFGHHVLDLHRLYGTTDPDR